ncbi:MULTISPECIES: hypothetical protein [Rhodococcus]|uniref:hypothetical protein n=1 Tax=Rhodococcus TaxID=1827 RepID=UPI000B27BD8D|nr:MULTISPECIES: hypothetical protein [Rhodococcus]MEA1797969.1 hypothetical protein [Rhodococcus qingshengii]
MGPTTAADVDVLTVVVFKSGHANEGLSNAQCSDPESATGLRCSLAATAPAVSPDRSSLCRGLVSRRDYAIQALGRNGAALSDADIAVLAAALKQNVTYVAVARRGFDLVALGPLAHPFVLDSH